MHQRKLTYLLVTFLVIEIYIVRRRVAERKRIEKIEVEVIRKIFLKRNTLSLTWDEKNTESGGAISLNSYDYKVLLKD